MSEVLNVIAARLHEHLSVSGIPIAGRPAYLAETTGLSPDDAAGILRGTFDATLDDLEQVAGSLGIPIMSLQVPAEREPRMRAATTATLHAVLAHDGIPPEDRAGHLAERTDTDPGEVAQWLAGEVQPGLWETRKIRDALTVSVDMLWGMEPLDLAYRDFLMAYRENPPWRQRQIQRAMLRTLPENRTPRVERLLDRLEAGQVSPDAFLQLVGK